MKFSKRIMNYKKANNVYEFNDIAIMSINILKRKLLIAAAHLPSQPQSQPQQQQPTR